MVVEVVRVENSLAKRGLYARGPGLLSLGPLLAGLISPLLQNLQREGGNVLETYKVGFSSALAALAVAAASFMAFSGLAMAVECEHTGERGVIECGKND